MSLALMLEKHGIDFLVLEAYSDIAPARGSAIALTPGSFRILDQLGCYEPFHQKMQIRGVPQRLNFYKQNGELFWMIDRIGDNVEER